MPPLEFTYSRPHISNIPSDLDPASAVNLPSGVDGTRYQWVDLNSEGLTGVLVDEGSAWYYRYEPWRGPAGTAAVGHSNSICFLTGGSAST